MILASTKDGKWHAVPWPVLALAHHATQENLWNWLSYSLSWTETAKNVNKLATVTRVKDTHDFEILGFDGSGFHGVDRESNGLHDYMGIGIDVLIDAELVKVVRDTNGVDLVIPTTELVSRAKSSAELNNGHLVRR